MGENHSSAFFTSLCGTSPSPGTILFLYFFFPKGNLFWNVSNNQLASLTVSCNIQCWANYEINRWFCQRYDCSENLFKTLQFHRLEFNLKSKVQAFCVPMMATHYHTMRIPTKLWEWCNSTKWIDDSPDALWSRSNIDSHLRTCRYARILWVNFCPVESFEWIVPQRLVPKRAVA